MAKYSVYGRVVATKFIGEFEADSEEEAIKMAEDEAYVSVCHQCSSEVDDPEVDELFAEEQ